MLTAHYFQITSQTDGSTFEHGPVYDHTPAAALALVRLTFASLTLWDVSISATTNEEVKMDTPPQPATQTELFL